MFDPIKGPTNHYEGPATGHSTEKGDSWHTAVSKINAGFEAVTKAIEAPVDVVDSEVRKELADLRETVAALQIKLDEQVARADRFSVSAAPTPVTTEPTTPTPTAEDAVGNG